MTGRARAATFILAAALFGALALSAIACASGTETQEEIVARLRSNADDFEYAVGTHGGTITYSTIGEPLTFNLPLANDASSSGYLSYVFEGLTETSWLDDAIEPLLAESWEHSDDGREWTFHLRRDVTWHDGEPLTAHDVEFTFNRIIYNDDIPTTSREAFIFVYTDEATGEQKDGRMTVTALDDYTVRFVLPVSYAPFLRSMGSAIYPRHILGPYVDAGTFQEVWDVESDPSEVVGTGPFTIASYTPGERVTLRRNPDYWKRDSAGNSLPYIDEIVYLVVDNLEEELALFQAGRTDAHGVLGEEYPVLEPLQEEGGFTIHRRGPGFGTTFLTFNVHPGANRTAWRTRGPRRGHGSTRSSSGRRSRTAWTRSGSLRRRSAASATRNGRPSAPPRGTSTTLT